MFPQSRIIFFFFFFFCQDVLLYHPQPAEHSQVQFSQSIAARDSPQKIPELALAEHHHVSLGSSLQLFQVSGLISFSLISQSSPPNHSPPNSVEVVGEVGESRTNGGFPSGPAGERVAD